MSLGALKQIAISEDTVEAKMVLILKVTATAPFIHSYAKGVGSLLRLFGDIKFGFKTSSLSKSDVLAVDVYYGTGGNALKHEIYPFILVFKLKFPFINSAGVIVGNIGLVAGIRIIYIGIVRIVVSKYLLTGRNGHSVPFFYNAWLVYIS